MPLTLPDLDDRSFADLVAEARALIPALAPHWTDHNPSDPGITLVELFAWLTETLLYRENQVTDKNRIAFLRLINGPDWNPAKSVTEEIRDTVVKLRMPARAVTASDFERIALGIPGVARAHCVPRRNLELATREDRAVDRPADVSLVVVSTSSPEPLAHLLDALDRARLLTTRVQVVAARPVPIGFDLTVHDQNGAIWRRDPPHAAVTLALTIHARPDMPGDKLLPAAEDELRCLFEPPDDDPAIRDWPFGRAVYLFEIWERLARLPGAEYVTATEGHRDEIEAGPEDNWRILKNRDNFEGIGLEPHELPRAAISSGTINVHSANDPAHPRP
jgi:hypothetical protein